MITVLAGGFGAARFLRGLVRVVPAAEVTIVGNTGDDINIYGVHVCPDLDIVTFMLAGVLDERRQFGLIGDTRVIMDELRAAGHDAWFDLGDRDYAICAARSLWLQEGVPLHRAIERMTARFDLETRLLPMTNEVVPTLIETDDKTMHFQEYWVRHRAAPRVRAVHVGGGAPAPGVLDAIAEADVVIVAPSNPVVSIDPILAVDGVRAALAATRAPVVAISPIVGGKVVRGMADKLLPAIGVPVSAAGVAGHYAGMLDGFILDEVDAQEAAGIGVPARAVPAIMRTPEDAAALAKQALDLAAQLRDAARP
ncbi:MAG TPA: 2-phospho-L-lactate transferase [Actinomycetota bacterium]